MTIPASAIRAEVRSLIDVQIETFRQTSPLSSSELAEYHRRAKKIRQLGQELDRMNKIAILEKRLGSAA